MLVLDLADPAQPILLSVIALPAAPREVCVRGDALFVPAGDAGVYIFNVADPAHPAQLGWFATHDSANDVAVIDDLACVADGYGGTSWPRQAI